MGKVRKTLNDEEVAAAEKAMQEKSELEAKELAEKCKKEAADKLATENSPKKPLPQKNTFIDKYAKSYPANKVFYVTSDNQVFLQGDHNMAVLHQKTLKEGELETIKVK